MKLNLTEIRHKEFIIVVVLILAVVDFVFFKYVLPPLLKKRTESVIKCKAYERRIYSLLKSIDKKKVVFKKIIDVNNQIETYKELILLLKNKKVGVLNVAHMIKALFLKSGINVVSFKVASVRKEKERIIYSFQVVIKDSLENIVKFIDIVENYSQNMQVPSFSLKQGKGLYQTNMNIEYVQVNAR